MPLAGGATNGGSNSGGADAAWRTVGGVWQFQGRSCLVCWGRVRKGASRLNSKHFPWQFWISHQYFGFPHSFSKASLPAMSTCSPCVFNPVSIAWLFRFFPLFTSSRQLLWFITCLPWGFFVNSNKTVFILNNNNKLKNKQTLNPRSLECCFEGVEFVFFPVWSSSQRPE